MKNQLYMYRAHVTSVYDGDTCTVDIDLGLKIKATSEKIRLYRINAPEVRGASRAEGLVSRDFLREMIQDKDIFLQTIKDKKGKYGRYLGEIWLEKSDGSFENMNDLLVSKGLAVYASY